MSTKPPIINKLEEAISVINELLKYGAHKGKCTNIDQFGVHDPLESCEKHVRAAKRRENNAIKFMTRQGYIPGGKV